jgi:hypothetical protein
MKNMEAQRNDSTASERTICLNKVPLIVVYLVKIEVQANVKVYVNEF